MDKSENSKSVNFYEIIYMRIGLFGGTFNPIHKGHLHAVKKVQDIFAFDDIYIIPSALPPHKELSDMVHAEDRIEMIRLALTDNPCLMKSITISDVELKRGGPSYTIDTISHFKTILANKTRFYFILGIDAFLEIDTWKSYMQLFDLVSFIVMTRPGFGDSATIGNKLEQYIKSTISDKYRFSISDLSYRHVEKKPVFISDVKTEDISSSMIRKFVRQGKNNDAFLHANVNNYIKNKGLYL